MMVHSVERRFSRAAHTYDQQAELQRQVARLLLSNVESSAAGKILDVGCGTGFLTQLLLERFPRAEIHGLDISAAMLKEAERRLGNERLAWILADAALDPLECKYDLIVSSSALQWAEPLSAAFRNLYQALNAGGELVVSCMTDGTLAELHQVRAQVAPGKLPKRVLPSAKEMSAAAEDAGFSPLTTETAVLRRTYPDAQSLLRCLHELGVTGGRISSGGTPLSRSELAGLKEIYSNRFGVPEGVEASYLITTLCAQKS